MEGREDASWRMVGAILLLITGAVQLAYGVAGIAGLGVLEGHVREIERNPLFGTLYLSLAGWGVMLTVIGVGQLAAGWRLLRQSAHARLFGLAAALFALALAFFTLALYRGGAVATVVLALSTLYVLSYRVNESA